MLYCATFTCYHIKVQYTFVRVINDKSNNKIVEKFSFDKLVFLDLFFPDNQVSGEKIVSRFIEHLMACHLRAISMLLVRHQKSLNRLL